MLTLVLTLAWSWLGPPPPEGLPHWQWPQYAPQPPALAAPDPALGPGVRSALPQPAPARPQAQGPER